MRPRILQMTATAALVAGLSFSSAPAFAQAAGDFEKGVEAFDLGKYKDAIALWQPLADDGNVEALRNMAQLYRLGLGVQQDDAKAFELYEKAADRGLAAAQVNAAFLLLTGKGVEQDRAKAATWFAKAADQGNPLAQYNLGLMYEKGIGVRKNDEFALELYRLAADQGQRRAIARLEAMEGAAEAEEIQKAEAAAAGSDEAKAETDAPKPAYVQKHSAEKDEESKSAEAEAEADAPKPAYVQKHTAEKEEDAETAEASDLSIKPVKIEPLEFEAIEKASSPEMTAMPAYKPSATQNPEQDTRPIVNVVRTPTRKPGVVDPDAPKGDEPTPVYVQTVKADEGDDAESADMAEAEDGDAPTPAYVQKHTADKDDAPTPAYVQKHNADKDDAETAEAASATDGGAPEPAYVIRETSDDTKASASTSTSQMRAPSDPVARVKMAEKAYRGGDFAQAADLLAPLSEAGMPIAQFWMGRLYNRGEGVDLNRAEAYSLWRSAAASGSNRAATALANLASRLSADEIAYAEQQHAASGRAR